VREKGEALTIRHGGHCRRVPAANVLVERAGTAGVSLQKIGELVIEELLRMPAVKVARSTTHLNHKRCHKSHYHTHRTNIQNWSPRPCAMKQWGRTFPVQPLGWKKMTPLQFERSRS
jgi:hypothetical protein